MCSREIAPNEIFETQKKKGFETVCSHSDVALANLHIAFLRCKPARGELRTHVEQNHVVLLAMREE